jgi:hypothetical protein
MAQTEKNRLSSGDNAKIVKRTVAFNFSAVLAGSFPA